MNNNTIRKATYKGQTVYFHHWLIKAFDDNSKHQNTYALIEFGDGRLDEVSAESIQFIDAPDEDKRAQLRHVEYMTKGKKKSTGFFHQWMTRKDGIGAEYVTALIEDESGEMLHIDTFQGEIKFQHS